MGTIADKLTYLNETKQAIKQAIIDKGVTVADTDTFRSYASKIESISDEPTKTLFYPLEYDANGYITKAKGIGITSIPDYAFSVYSSVNKNLFYYMQEYEILNSVTSIGYGAFYLCSSLESITIPNSVTSIGSYAFRGCTKLQNIVFKGQCQNINDYRFSNGSTSYPRTYDFRYCSSVPTLSNVSYLGGNTADYYEKIIVPDNLYDTWVASTNWSTIASKIVKVSEV